MKTICHSKFSVVVAGMCLASGVAVSVQAQTYVPGAWDNATSSPNPNFTLTEANTTHLPCQNTGAAQI